MASAQALLKRVAKLEAARTPRPSPIVALFGSVDAFADVEGLDPIDFPIVTEALRRWERDGVFGVRRRNSGVWP